MANFYGNCRSNYVRAKNPKRLKQILEEYDVNIIETPDELIGFVSISKVVCRTTTSLHVTSVMTNEYPSY